MLGPQVFLDGRNALPLRAGTDVQYLGDFTVHTVGGLDQAAVHVHQREVVGDQIADEQRVQRDGLAGARWSGHVHGRGDVVVDVFPQERAQTFDFVFAARQRVREPAVQTQQRSAKAGLPVASHSTGTATNGRRIRSQSKIQSDPRGRDAAVAAATTTLAAAEECENINKSNWKYRQTTGQTEGRGDGKERETATAAKTKLNQKPSD